jgi:hypothetical protein
MVPVSSQNNKILDAESHSSKSKRKMFKVVQRKRTTPDEPEILSDSDNEMPGSTNTSENCFYHNLTLVLIFRAPRRRHQNFLLLQ